MTHLDTPPPWSGKQPGRLKIAKKWQRKARKAAKKSLFHTSLMMRGGDPIAALYWQREAAYRATQAKLHLLASMGGEDNSHYS